MTVFLGSLASMLLMSLFLFRIDRLRFFGLAFFREHSPNVHQRVSDHWSRLEKKEEEEAKVALSMQMRLCFTLCFGSLLSFMVISLQAFILALL